MTEEVPMPLSNRDKSDFPHNRLIDGENNREVIFVLNKRREKLISQVKEEYANITASDSQQHFHQTAAGITPEAYYGTLLNAVIADIENGKFDNCASGAEIVNKVAADKSILSDWN